MKGEILMQLSSAIVTGKFIDLLKKQQLSGPATVKWKLRYTREVQLLTCWRKLAGRDVGFL